MAERDYYEILGVSRNATEEQIRSAYRRLARKYHPDLNPGDPAAEQKFKELGKAYETLIDPKKRQAYDQFGPEGVRLGAGAGAGPGGFRYTWSGEGSPFEDVVFEAFGGGGAGASIFEDLFSRLAGGRGRRTAGAARVARRGEDIESEITIPFDQAIHGARMTITVQRPGGDGSVRPERIDVRIPPGVRDGQRLRLRGQGGPGLGGAPAGDLYLVVHVAEHPFFRRDGHDIYIDLPVTVSEATLGAKVDVPTIHGRMAVTIPPGTASGTRLRLRGQGVADGKTGQRGDQYCVIRIIPPRNLDDRARALFEQLRSLQRENPRAGPPWTS